MNQKNKLLTVMWVGVVPAALLAGFYLQPMYLGVTVGVLWLVGYAAICRWLIQSLPDAAPPPPPSHPSESPDVDPVLVNLGRRVVPIWTRQIESARSHTETAVSALASNFSGLAAQLTKTNELSEAVSRPSMPRRRGRPSGPHVLPAA